MSIHRDDELARRAIALLDESSPGMTHNTCPVCGEEDATIQGRAVDSDPATCPCDYCCYWSAARELIEELAERLEARRDAEIAGGGR